MRQVAEAPGPARAGGDRLPVTGGRGRCSRPDTAGRSRGPGRCPACGRSDRWRWRSEVASQAAVQTLAALVPAGRTRRTWKVEPSVSRGARIRACLLYTSDAADDLTRVDLG